MGGRGSSSASSRSRNGPVKGYFDYRNRYTGQPGERSTQKQRDLIASLTKDPFDRADATLRLGTLSDASKMTKREASWYIDELLNKSAYSEYRVGGEAFQRLVREQDTLRMLNNVRMSGVRGGKPPTELKVRLLTSQIGTAPKLLNGPVIWLHGLLTSQIGTAPKHAHHSKALLEVCLPVRLALLQNLAPYYRFE